VLPLCARSFHPAQYNHRDRTDNYRGMKDKLLRIGPSHLAYCAGQAWIERRTTEPMQSFFITLEITVKIPQMQAR
jgi:hypothetical protein